MDELLRVLGLVVFGVTVTAFVSVLLGRLVSRKGVALWVWDRSGSIGRVLIAVGFGLALFGLSQGQSPTASSLILIGSLIGLAGIWMVTFV